jgi:phage FluMu protein Com
MTLTITKEEARYISAMGGVYFEVKCPKCGAKIRLTARYERG